MNSTEKKPLENAAGRAQSGNSDAFGATASESAKGNSSSMNNNTKREVTMTGSVEPAEKRR